MVTEGITHKPALSCAAAATPRTHNLGKYQGRQQGEKTEGTEFLSMSLTSSLLDQFLVIQ